MTLLRTPRTLVEKAVADFQKLVPALAGLKLVIELELRGRGDVQLYRVELPGPKITKDIASDAKVRVSIPRSHFNELVEHGGLRYWREAFESGHARARARRRPCKLIEQVVRKQEERERTQPRARHTAEAARTPPDPAFSRLHGAETLKPIASLLQSKRLQRALDTFVLDFTRRWRWTAQTLCRRGYRISDCANGPEPRAGR